MYRIGIYAHNHGYGHCSYANQIARYNKDQFWIFTSSDFEFDKGVNVIRLPNEDITGTELKENPTNKPDYLHHNPQGNGNITRRSSILIKTVIDLNIDFLLVDVSVEIAMLARVTSIPYAYCRMLGNRTDLAHLNAYQSSQFNYAFYPEVLESEDTPSWLKDKTIYLGFTSSYHQEAYADFTVPEIPKRILVIQGRGGNNFNQSSLKEIEKQFSEASIQLIGDYNDVYSTTVSKVHGFVQNPQYFVQQADLIIAACGSNTVNMIIAMGRRFLAIPETRPYEEQKCMARQLESLKLAAEIVEDNYYAAFQRLQSFEIDNATVLTTVTAQQFSDNLVALGFDTLKLKTQQSVNYNLSQTDE